MQLPTRWKGTVEEKEAFLPGAHSTEGHDPFVLVAVKNV